MGIEAPKLKIDFKKGDRVKVTSGPFFDFTGVVDEIAPEKERLRALISIFGRETPVELSFSRWKRSNGFLAQATPVREVIEGQKHRKRCVAKES